MLQLSSTWNYKLKRMIRKTSLVLILIIFSLSLFSQGTATTLKGKVSFVTPQSVYVKFQSTSALNEGDTLFVNTGGKQVPALVIINKSSVSCVCRPLTSTPLQQSQELVAKIKSVKSNASETTVTKEKQAVGTVAKQKTDTVAYSKAKSKAVSHINGSISAYSYNYLSKNGSDNFQLKYSYVLNAVNIGNSRFSIDNYVTFRHKPGDWSKVKDDPFSALKIYNLAFRYDKENNIHLSLGRAFNQRVSSLGANDGLQVEKNIGQFSVGVIGGTRPDYLNYFFNKDLLQYGGYLAFDTKANNFMTGTTVAFINQMNKGKTDRRYLYFQHSGSYGDHFYFFGTGEFDMYSLLKGEKKNNLDITSIYFSLRYRAGSNLSFTASYDQRKNIIFYETYKSLLDSVIQNEKRQSFRLQTNIRLAKNITLGLEGGYRFLKTDTKPSRNISGYLTMFQIAPLGLTFMLNGTWLESSFLTGTIAGAGIMRDFFQGKLQLNAGYRYQKYKLSESTSPILQNVAEAGIYVQAAPKLSFSVNYEGSFEKTNNFNSIFLQLRKRF